MNKNLKHIALFSAGIVLLNILSYSFFERFDLTKDSRYTLSNTTLNILDEAKSPVIIDVFLKGENFPSEFKRLQNETKQLLEEFSAESDQIIFNFFDPLEDEQHRDIIIEQLTNRGLTPMQFSVQENGSASQSLIFPWALASYNGQTITIPLIKNKIGASEEELVANSIQHLEYAFTDGFSKLIKGKQKKIAILRGNSQLKDKHLADFLRKIGEYYFIAPFTLDSVAKSPQKTLKQLDAYDLIINAKPTEAFTEEEKYVLDQYSMNGGKSLWLIDAVAMEKDSLYNAAGKNFAVYRDLNLTDLLFPYGVRVNPLIVSTLFSAPITVAIGEGSNSQYQPLRWPYSPLANSTSKHPIVNNLNLVKFDFANPIDTLKNNIKKTILLTSETLSKLEGTPRVISLDIVTQEPDPLTFNKGKQTLAVLLEGEFTSAYKDRIKPFDLKNDSPQSKQTKMIFISDGDVIKNDVVKNEPQELGFDRWTGEKFGNKEFLLNCVNYLLDDTGLINIRSKEVAIAFLNKEKIAEEKTKWQLINIVFPIVLLALFGFGFNFYRKKKYTS